MCEDLPDEISLEPLLGLETCIDVRPDVVSDVLNAGVVDFGDVDDNEAMLAFAQDDEWADGLTITFLISCRRLWTR